MIKNLTKAVLMLAAGALLFTPAQGQAKHVIKIGHGLTEFSAMHLGWVKFKEEIEKRSNGEFTVEIYPNCQLGSDREMAEAVQLGNLTINTPSSTPLAAFAPDYFVLDAPFMFNNRAEAFAFLDGPNGQQLLKNLEKINIKGLGYFENGFRNLTNSVRKVTKPEDMKGIKLRVMESPIHLKFWQLVGANPTPMAFGEVFTALQQKTIDGQENPFGQIYDNKYYEIQPYISRTQHIYTPFPIIMNLEFWEELNEDEQKLVVECVKIAEAYQRQQAEELDDKKAEQIIAAGREITDLTDEERAAFRHAMAPVADLIKEKVSPEIFKMYTDYMATKD